MEDEAASKAKEKAQLKLQKTLEKLAVFKAAQETLAENGNGWICSAADCKEKPKNCYGTLVEGKLCGIDGFCLGLGIITVVD